MDFRKTIQFFKKRTWLATGLIFALALAYAGYLFYFYAYQVSNSEVPLEKVAVKEDIGEKLIEEFNLRESRAAGIEAENIRDIFAK